MRSRISIRGCVRRSVGPSVRRSHTSWISEKWAEFEQNSIRNKKVCHLKDYSKTSTRAVRQRTHLLSELCSTCLSSYIWLFPLLFLAPRSKPVFCKHRFEKIPYRVLAIDGAFEKIFVSAFRCFVFIWLHLIQPSFTTTCVFTSPGRVC